MTCDEIFERIQAAYDFANEVMPELQTRLLYSNNGYYYLAIDVSEISRDDSGYIPVADYGYDTKELFTPRDLQDSNITRKDIREHYFGEIPIIF